ncbi:MAG: hypothetical protein N3D10_01430 [Candidatus Micrarchaeota archaeon]|nr:hypothetical protein [Candidatus Micrarchaeota archaeon]
MKKEPLVGFFCELKVDQKNFFHPYFSNLYTYTEGLEQFFIDCGFSQEEIQRLFNQNYFLENVVDPNEFLKKFQKIVSVYGKENLPLIKKALLVFPQLLDIEHEARIDSLTKIYGNPNLGQIKKAILLYPRFLGLGHVQIINSLTKVYGKENTELIKKAILNFPPFGGFDFDYQTSSNKSKKKKTSLVVHHLNVINSLKKIYSKQDISLIKKLVLAYPTLINYDFTNSNFHLLLRQKMRLAKLLGLDQNKARKILFTNPWLINHDFSYLVAVIDVFKEIAKEKDLTNYTSEDLVKLWLKNHNSSPFIESNTRLSKAKKLGIPPDSIPLYKKLINKI